MDTYIADSVHVYHSTPCSLETKSSPCISEFGPPRGLTFIYTVLQEYTYTVQGLCLVWTTKVMIFCWLVWIEAWAGISSNLCTISMSYSQNKQIPQINTEWASIPASVSGNIMQSRPILVAPCESDPSSSNIDSTYSLKIRSARLALFGIEKQRKPKTKLYFDLDFYFYFYFFPWNITTVPILLQ